MDAVDKKIILALFKDGRVSQRKIAEEVGLSATSLNYRFNKLLEEKIIKSFSLYVNPNFYGKYVGRASFKNVKDLEANFINVKVKCLEETNFYEFEGSSMGDLQDKLSYMSKTLGEPAMVYIPDQSPQKPSGVDIEIVRTLIKNPRMDVGEISKAINIPSKTILRRLNALINKNYIRIIPIIDLGKSDITTFAIYSHAISKLEFLQRCEFLRFVDHDRGVIVCATNDLKEAESYVKEVRQIDPSSQVMIAIDYEIRNENAEKELDRIESEAMARNS